MNEVTCKRGKPDVVIWDLVDLTQHGHGAEVIKHVGHLLGQQHSEQLCECDLVKACGVHGDLKETAQTPSTTQGRYE